MAQLQLPIFTESVKLLAPELGVCCRDGRVSYFYGTLPVFTHASEDVNSFRMFTSQLYVGGKVSQADLVKIFGVTAISVKRAVKTYRQSGPGGFWKPRKSRGAAVLTPPVLAEIQAQLSQGASVAEVASQRNLKVNTLKKAVAAGRLHVFKKGLHGGDAATDLSNKSQRSQKDAVAVLGVGATNEEGRLLASLGKGGPVVSRFEPCADVPRAGVLLALPALLASGLWKHTEKHFTLPEGYYQLAHVFLLMAFLALARVKSLESLRYCSPGEWGKVLGLDRIPEVRTLRDKLALLGQADKVAAWAEQLSREWMAEDPESAGTLYVDGHVRTYHGSQARLPKHYVPRQRLCLRATTDYWVNAMDGQPFFVVHSPVDPGLQQVLETEIIPRLLLEVPNQPSQEELDADPQRDKFIVVFDREGYSPDLFQRLKQQRIGCLTYHKHPGADWPVEQFKECEVQLAHGNRETMKLAERRTVLSNGMEMRQIRQLEDNGHQTAMLASAEKLGTGQTAVVLFSRWSQENFLKYMREHYALDRLLSYQTEKMDETTHVVNPEWRKLDRQIRRQAAQLHPKLARLGKLNLPTTIEPENMEEVLKEKTKLHSEIQQVQESLAALKEQRTGVSHHVPMGQLPESERFDRLSYASKDLVDTIKLIAYRAETAMAHVTREALPQSHADEARRLLQSLYASDADLIPDEKAGTLTVRLHYPANPMLGRVVEKLCEEFTATETVFPTTKLRLIYELVSNHNPPYQGM